MGIFDEGANTGFRAPFAVWFVGFGTVGLV